MRTAIVTGASRGIGRAIVDMLLDGGWTVRGVSRTDPGVEHAAFGWWQWDVSQPHAAGPIGGRYDALIHCAGIRGPYGPFQDNDPDAWERTITTNLLGTVRVVRACLPALKRSDDGRILLMSGGGAFDPSPGFSAYAASKAGTVALMETLAVELADSTVTVNCLAPGFVPTTIHTGTPYEGVAGDADALGRAVACVRHLLSPQTHGLTGKTVSAAYDDWEHISGWNVERINASSDGTRSRHPLHMLAARYRAS